MMKPITGRDLQQKKNRAEKITALTCYDATFAHILDTAPIDILLIGDSLGMTICGNANTLNVTVKQIIHHTRAVSSSAKHAHIVADMPFLSYQTSDKDAVKNAGKLLQAGAHAVKLEGGQAIASTVSKLVTHGIPVMGHIGIKPQSVHHDGGYIIKGRSSLTQQALLDDALALEKAGVYAIVLEGIQSDCSAAITKAVRIPTIGISAGPDCDGQILVIYDLLGLNPEFRPRFVKPYLDGYALISRACQEYAAEVKSGQFPGPEHSFAPIPQHHTSADHDPN